MATADQVKALVRSHGEGDDARFYSVALQVAAHAARSGQGRFAQELRDLVDTLRTHTTGASGQAGRPVPVARPKGELADLLTVAYPTASPSRQGCGSGSTGSCSNNASRTAYARTGSIQRGAYCLSAHPEPVRPDAMKERGLRSSRQSPSRNAWAAETHHVEGGPLWTSMTASSTSE